MNGWMHGRGQERNESVEIMVRNEIEDQMIGMNTRENQGESQVEDKLRSGPEISRTVVSRCASDE